jgi:RHS repeat-associated protein
MTVRYTVVDGEIIAEKRSGTRSLYVPDPHGSTIALLNSAQTITDVFSYWAYGINFHGEGSNPTPFIFLGTLGYYKDDVNREYVRARVLDKVKARWITPDPSGFGPSSLGLADGYPYGYANNNPVNYVDLDGNAPQRLGQKPGIPVDLKNHLNAQAQTILLQKLNNKTCASAIQQACKAGGLAALNNPKLVPRWEFPTPSQQNPYGSCNPNDPRNTGACRALTLPRGQKPVAGARCIPKGICISYSSYTNKNPNMGACAVIFELGNACACKYQGYDPSEKTGQQLDNACGCKGVLIPGGPF